MIVSKKWLQDFIVEKLPETNVLEDGLIMHVFEVEGVEKVGDDEVFDVKTLPDRNHYALSHRGVAKEIAAIFNLTFKDIVEIKELPESQKLSIKIEDEKLCRRYCAARIEGVKIAPSPAWLKERLEAVGQKSINNIVDATNYTMLSMGQPLHAFDADKVVGGIMARAGKVGETLTLLDASGAQKDRVLELGKGECVIEDDSGPLVLAGIKGGAKTAISENTTNIILEAANFDPVVTRKFSTIYNLRNETSKRFENEITPEYARESLQTCVDLILQIAGGTLEGMKDVYPHVFPVYKVSVTREDVKKLIGVDISHEEVSSILKRLRFDFEMEGETYVVTAPSERLDIRIKEDLIEEIGRIYGYHHVIARRPQIATEQKTSKEYVVETIIRELLISKGFSEVYSYAFQPSGEIELANALASDKSFVRKNIKDQLAVALEQNTRYADLLGLSKIKIFEIGNVFTKQNETTTLALGVSYAKKIKGETPESEIQNTMGDVLESLGIQKEQVNFEVKNDVMEIDMNNLVSLAPDSLELPLLRSREVKKYQPISLYPFVVRDIAVWVQGEGKENEVEEIIKTEAGDLLKRLSQFDKFSKDGKTSYAYRLVLQSMEKTLQENEITDIMTRVTKKMNANEGWNVR